MPTVVDVVLLGNSTVKPPTTTVAVVTGNGTGATDNATGNYFYHTNHVFAYSNCKYCFLMHLWPGNSGEFNFSFFKAPLKSPALPDLMFGKVPAQRPGTPGDD